jgi:predicted transcriptional regulator
MMNDLRSRRTMLGMSQSKLARISGVKRFKICTFELGDCPLTPEEQKKIGNALQAETERLRSLPAKIDLGEFGSADVEAE